MEKNAEEIKVGKFKMEVTYQGRKQEISAYRTNEGDTYVVTRHIHIYLGVTYHATTSHLPEWEKTGKIHREVIGLDSRTLYVPTRELDLLKKEIHSVRDRAPQEIEALPPGGEPEIPGETT